MFGGDRLPSFLAFLPAGRAELQLRRCPVALRLCRDGKLWMLLQRYNMINLQASENTYDLAFGLVSVVSLRGLLITHNAHQAVS